MDYPHPYIMDLSAYTQHLAPDFAGSEEMFHEFVEYFNLNHNAQAFLAENVELIAAGKKPKNWPNIQWHLPTT